MIPIRCLDVSKRFGKVQAVAHLDLEVPEHAIFGLVGPSGAEWRRQDHRGSRYEPGNSLVSYSPFPANGGLYPMEARSGGSVKTTELTVTTRKPIAHFWRRFEVHGLRLADF
jgi:hypothetical protein